MSPKNLTVGKERQWSQGSHITGATLEKWLKRDTTTVEDIIQLTLFQSLAMAKWVNFKESPTDLDQN